MASGNETLPDLVNTWYTWYRSFYDDYMAYIKTAERDAVLAAQIASPGTQVIIGFITAVLEEAELKASSSSASGLSPGFLLGAEVPVGLLAIEVSFH